MLRRLSPILFLLCPLLVPGQTYYVPLEHRVYRVINYYETTGRVDTGHQQKPYTREEIQHWLVGVLEQSVPEPDRRLVQRYLDEFEDRDRHLVRYDKDQMRFFGDLIAGGQTRSFRETNPFHNLDIGGNIRGQFGPSLTFQTNIITRVYLGNLDFTTGYGIQESLAPFKHHNFQKSASGDFSESQVIASTGWGHISFGSDLVAWGPGTTGNLLLNIAPFSLPDIHVSAQLGPFRYIKLFGTLDKLYPTANGGGKDFLADKRKIAAHRLDVRVSPRFRFGVSESVIYNRDLELVYLNPLMPFVISEVQTGDADNNLAAVDAMVKLTGNTRTYLEFMVDDLDFRQDFFRDYVNKWAVLLGHQWAVSRALITLEAVRVEPYVYTHRDTANHYEYFGESLGYDLQPNSLRYVVRADWFQRVNLWHQITLSQTIRGAGDRIYGNPADMTAPKEFLKGTIEARTGVTWKTEYEFFENMWLTAGLTFEKIANEKAADAITGFGGDRTLSGLTIGINCNY